MKSRGSGWPLRTALIVVFCILATVIASGAIVAGVIESNRVASAKRSAAAARPQASEPTARPVQQASKTPPSTSPPTVTVTPTAAPPPIAAIASPAPEVVPEPPMAAAPVQPQPTRARARACPEGTVTSTLTSVDYEESAPYGHLEVSITGRGTITNGTTAAVQIMQTDVPDLEGLDERGQIVTIQTTGTYDWAPPPGTPSGGVIDLQPGQTLSFTVVESNYGAPTTVKYWYSSTESGSVLMYFTDFVNANCHVFGMPDKVGTSIPNTFVPKGK